MNKPFFPGSQKTVIAAIMEGITPQEIIAVSRAAEFDGADAICLSLRELRPEFRNRQSLAEIFHSVSLPFMVYYYRENACGPVEADEARQKLLLEAAKAGASVIDVMGDLYAPAPETQRTLEKRAITRQRRMVDKIHALGAQVVMSSHTTVFLKAEQALEQLRDFEARGADIVKIVIPVNTEEEFQETVRTTMLLRRELQKPFIHLAGGNFAKIQRFLGMSLGVSVTFAVEQFNARNPAFCQPTVKAMKDVRDTIRWHISNLDK